MIIKIVLCFGLCVMLMLALGQPFIRKKSHINRLLFLLLIVSSIWFSHALAHLFGLTDNLPHLNKASLVFIAFTGPLYYLYHQTLYSNYSINLATLTHGIPGLLVLLLAIPFYLQTGDYKLNYSEREISDFTTATMYLSMRLSEITTMVYMTLTAKLLFQKIRADKAAAKINTTVHIMLVLTVFGFIAVSSRLLGMVTGLPHIGSTLPALLTAVIFLVLYLLSYENPSLLGLHFGRRKNNTMGKVDNKLLHQYEKTIEKEQLYLDDELTLSSLAKHLNTRPHELSSLINQTAQTNFTDFINSFRIEYAKRQLLGDRNQPIVDICYASGFNSKSVFYKYFNKATGKTPSQYRKTQ